MKTFSASRIATLGALAAFFALTSANCGARTYITCTGLCENALPCNDTYNQCMAFCEAVQKKCGNNARPAVFMAYIACTTDAGFSCDYEGGDAGGKKGDAGDGGDGGRKGDAGDGGRKGDGGKGDDAGDAGLELDAAGPTPIANAPCEIEQAELIQCDAPDEGPGVDAKLDVPQGLFDAGLDCPDAASCLDCCVAAYPLGAQEFRNAVTACVCGPGGACSTVCSKEACNIMKKDGGGVMPTSTDASEDPCDTCLSAALDEQSPEAGVCVRPVNAVCDTQKDVECAAYANCVSQMGCTN
jgi:hypothetical protein